MLCRLFAFALEVVTLLLLVLLLSICRLVVLFMVSPPPAPNSLVPVPAVPDETELDLSRLKRDGMAAVCSLQSVQSLTQWNSQC